MAYTEQKILDQNFLLALNQAKDIDKKTQLSLINRTLRDDFPICHAVIIFYTGQLETAPSLDDRNLAHRLLTPRERTIAIKMPDSALRDIFAIYYVDSVAVEEDYILDSEAFNRAISSSLSLIPIEKRVEDFIALCETRGLVLRDPPIGVGAIKPKAFEEETMVVYEMILDQPGQMIRSVAEFYQDIEKQEKTESSSQFYKRPRGKKESEFHAGQVTLVLGRLLALRAIEFNSSGKIELRRAPTEDVLVDLLRESEGMTIAELGSCFINKTSDLDSVLKVYLRFLISKGVVVQKRGNRYALTTKTEADLRQQRKAAEDRVKKTQLLVKSWKKEDKFGGSLWGYLPNTSLLNTWLDAIERFRLSMNAVVIEDRPVEELLEDITIPVERIAKFAERVEIHVSKNQKTYTTVLKKLESLRVNEIFSKKTWYSSLNIKIEESAFPFDLKYFKDKTAQIKKDFQNLKQEHAKASLPPERVDGLGVTISWLIKEHKELEKVCKEFTDCWNDLKHLYDTVASKRKLIDEWGIPIDSLSDIATNFRKKLKVIQENAKIGANVTEEIQNLLGEGK